MAKCKEKPKEIKETKEVNRNIIDKKPKIGKRNK